jgi:dipeptidyl aminopeptidase/acylaminoacyl peptidase
MVQTAPYGSWKSPITSDLIVASSIRLGEIRLDHNDIYWSELRPQEAGRLVIVRRTPDGTKTDVTPAPFNVRTRVHEYGGAAYTVHNSTVYFSNFADQRLYRQAIGTDPQPITPEGQYRYADAVFDAQHQRLICIREDHSTSEREAVNTITSVQADQDEKGGTVLVEGNDFYSSPRLSPDGLQIAWLTWNHPNMPWDGTELWMASIQPDGTLGTAQQVAGGMREAVFQPEWSPDGVLYFISDRTGWWNLYRWQSGQVEPVYQVDAEFGSPHWVFGQSTYGFESTTSILCTYLMDGVQHLSRLNLGTATLSDVDTPYSQFGGLRVGQGLAAFVAGSPTKPSAIARLDLNTHQIEELQQSNTIEVDPGYLSEPEVITFPTVENLTAYGIYYPPQNQDYQPAADERPPLLVKSHGGPTAATSTAFNLGVQYWTSRGFAVLDVNYGGSTGYGRAYRERLRGRWGVVDIDDCCNGAKYLVEQGKVDGERLAIDGGSAGGYTTLGALTFRDVFQAGASYYGVSDMVALAEETHKFESRYLDGLVGPYPATKEIYQQRSPINHVDQLSCPVIFFQGDEDKIVPPNQAELMVDALKQKGIPVAYVLFEGEQHGFRKAENIKRALDTEFYFYSRIFGFEPAESIDPVEIMNLD